MKKIPTLLKRDPENRSRVLPELGVDIFVGRDWADPTPKWDGTCVRLSEDGNWFARREVKPGKAIPEDFQEIDFDKITGKRQGWVPITDEANFRWHNEAIGRALDMRPGTYELVGPHINGNPHKFEQDIFVTHGAGRLHPFNFWFNEDGTVNMDQIASDMKWCPYEGWVFWTEAGPVAKLKRRDFELSWPVND